MSRRLRVFALIEVVAIVLALLVAVVAAPPTDDFTKFAGVFGFMLGLITALNGIVMLVLGREEDQSVRETAERRKAYEELSKLASTYYGALSRLQTGDWDAAAVATAESGMDGGGGLTPRLNADQQQVWWDFHQEGLNVADRAAALGSASAVAARQQLWRDSVAALAGKLERVKALATFE